MLRLICSIGVLSFTAGCAGLDPFPADRLWEVDLRSKNCGEYVISQSGENLSFRHLKDHPLSECPNVFGFSAKDIPKVIDWSEDAIRFAKRKCK